MFNTDKTPQLRITSTSQAPAGRSPIRALTAVALTLTIGFDGSLALLAQEPQETPEALCDRLAAHPSDREAAAPGVSMENLRAEAALAPCEAASKRSGALPRYRYQYGRVLYALKNYEGSVVEAGAAAEAGYAMAQTLMGLAYMEGRGVTRDDAEAIKQFKLAADAGNPSAQGMLAYAYESGRGVGKDDVVALEWYRRAAVQGDPNAQFNLGRLYSAAKSPLRDDVEASQWFRRAALSGLAVAQQALGWAYYHGQGMPPDRKEAFSWLVRAANQGLGDAQYSVGMLLKQESRFQEAYISFRKAADQGHSSSLAMIGLLYSAGWPGVPANPWEAARYFKRAADAGDLVGIAEHGYSLYTGYGTARNTTEGKRLIRVAADKGDEFSTRRLATIEKAERQQSDAVAALAVLGTIAVGAAIIGSMSSAEPSAAPTATPKTDDAQKAAESRAAESRAAEERAAKARAQQAARARDIEREKQRAEIDLLGRRATERYLCSQRGGSWYDGLGDSVGVCTK